MATYCTTEELARLTSSELSELVLEEIIDQADRQIKSRLRRMDVSIPSDSDDSLKAASIAVATTGVMTHPDSDQIASSIKLGDITIKRANIETTIADMEQAAWARVDDYILQHGREEASRFYFQKVN